MWCYKYWRFGITAYTASLISKFESSKQSYFHCVYLCLDLETDFLLIYVKFI